MAYEDRIFFETASTGTGAVSAGAAVNGYFLPSVVSNGACAYFILDPATGDAETGRGTWDNGAGTLARDGGVKQSSNADDLVSLGEGTKLVALHPVLADDKVAAAQLDTDVVLGDSVDPGDDDYTVTSASPFVITYTSQTQARTVSMGSAADGKRHHVVANEGSSSITIDRSATGQGDVTVAANGGAYLMVGRANGNWTAINVSRVLSQNQVTVTGTTHTLGHGRDGGTDERIPLRFVSTDSSSQACTFTVPADAANGDSWEVHGDRPTGQVVKVISASLPFVTGQEIATGVAMPDGPGQSGLVRIINNKVWLEGDWALEGTLAANVEWNNFIARRMRLKGFRENTEGSANWSGAVTVDYVDGVIERVLTGDVTSMTVNNWPSNAVGTLAFYLDLAGFSLALPSGVKHAGGEAPDIGAGEAWITLVRRPSGDVYFFLGGPDFAVPA